jgi:hypothetical protein
MTMLRSGTIKYALGGAKAVAALVGDSKDCDHSELLTSVPFHNLLVAKMERQLDILDVGHPGVEEHLVAVISMIEDELQK